MIGKTWFPVQTSKDADLLAVGIHEHIITVAVKCSAARKFIDSSIFEAGKIQHLGHFQVHANNKLICLTGLKKQELHYNCTQTKKNKEKYPGCLKCHETVDKTICIDCSTAELSEWGVGIDVHHGSNLRISTCFQKWQESQDGVK